MNYTQFIEDFCTYPLSLILLAVIIVVAGVWFFRYRPRELAERRKRDDEFLRAQQRYESLMTTQTQLYQKALDNSTKAIENNTEVVKILTERVNNLEDNQKTQTDAIKDLQIEARKLVEKAIELNSSINKERF